MKFQAQTFIVLDPENIPISVAFSAESAFRLRSDKTKWSEEQKRPYAYTVREGLLTWETEE